MTSPGIHLAAYSGVRYVASTCYTGLVIDALPQPHRLSRVEYDRLVERGEFDDRRVELIRGEIIRMSPQRPAHATIVKRLNKLFMRLLIDEVDIHIQAPFAVSTDSQPEPDVIVTEPGDYIEDHPAWALLVIEVADSSLTKDRGDKARLYAECGVPEYWVVNIPEQVIEVYLDPKGDTYQTTITKRRGENLSATTLPTVEFAVAELFRGIPPAGR